MLIVQCPGDRIILPQCCPCCLRPTDHQTKLQFDDTYHFGVAVANVAHTVKVPYCQDCEAHAEWYRDYGMAGTIAWVVLMSVVAVVVLGFVVMMGVIIMAAGLQQLGVSKELLSKLVLVGGVASTTLGVGGVAYWTWRYRTKRRPRAPIGEGHASRRSAAALVAASKEAVSLVFLSDRYAQMAASLSPNTRVFEPPANFLERPDRIPAKQIVSLVIVVLLAVLLLFVLRR